MDPLEVIKGDMTMTSRWHDNNNVAMAISSHFGTRNLSAEASLETFKSHQFWKWRKCLLDDDN